ncbi:hypothetical protein ACQ4PT_059829 [Festuca glaucescens]
MDPKRVRKSRKAAVPAELASRLAMLPADVVDEILLRLPAKSIARFRAASKSWHGTNVTLPRDLNWNLAVAGFYFHAPTAEYRVLCYRCDRTEHVRHVPPRERETVTRKHYDYSVAAVGRPEVSRLASTT